MSAPISRDLRARIEAAIGPFPGGILDVVRNGLQPALAIKYVPAEIGGIYHQPGQKLWISPTAGFTWGQATYVTTLAFPVSTAIFGRVGVVASFEPSNWRNTFDATDEANKRLYLRWLRAQPLYEKFVFTAHSAHFGQHLRNLFRESFQIDCVLFRPDQSNLRYTDPDRDVWMAVTDWNPDGTIKDGYSDRFFEVRLTALVDEEFKDENGGTGRSALLNLGASWLAADYSSRLRTAYYSGDIERIPS
jgi:hypothetical protein